MFYWRGTVTSGPESLADLAITGRSAARGEGPFAGLNLGGHVGDDPEAVEQNRSALAAQLRVGRDRLLFMNQVHGTDVAVVDGPWSTAPAPADAIVTRSPDLALAVLVADCVPVLLHDVEAGVIGAVHAGRPGMMAGLVREALGAMRDLGARSIAALVGPSVCGRCYEVPPQLAAAAVSVSPSAAARSWTGTAAIDVAAGVVEQLHDEAVSITWLPGCTREHEDLYSYRRDGTTGRFAGVVVLRGGGSS